MSTTTTTTSSTTPAATADAPVGIEELEQAWRAVRAGRFRPDGHRVAGDNGGPDMLCGPGITGPLVVVAVAHDARRAVAAERSRAGLCGDVFIDGLLDLDHRPGRFL